MAVRENEVYINTSITANKKIQVGSFYSSLVTNEKRAELKLSSSPTNANKIRKDYSTLHLNEEDLILLGKLAMHTLAEWEQFRKNNFVEEVKQ